MNTTQIIARCSEIIAGGWLGTPEQHDSAEDSLEQLIATLYAEDREEVIDALEALPISYRRTVITDRLDRLVDAENLDAYETDLIEIDDDEWEKGLASGEIKEVSEKEAQRLIKQSKKR